jgi:hypothetical protein
MAKHIIKTWKHNIFVNQKLWKKTESNQSNGWVVEKSWSLSVLSVFI